MYAQVSTYAYVCLRMSEVNDSNDTRARRKELELFYFYKGLALPLKWYSLI